MEVPSQKNLHHHHHHHHHHPHHHHHHHHLHPGSFLYVVRSVLSTTEILVEEISKLKLLIMVYQNCPTFQSDVLHLMY